MAKTHLVAVGAYVFREGRVLLLDRSEPPFTFAPPGGGLYPDEDPVAGLRREVREETGLEIRVIGVAHTWYGAVNENRPPLLGIDYLAECDNDEVTLSEEHHGYVWATREDIAERRVRTLDERNYGYQPKYILDSFDLYARLKDRMERY